MQSSTEARKRRGLTRGLALATAAVLGLSALVPAGATPALAAPPLQQSFVFDSPKGSDWVVPEGLTEVYVGIRGGSGGGAVVNGGKGANLVVAVPVKGGDVLTVYAGKTAHGSNDERIGGEGYIAGANGGKGSLTGQHAGGGGGAGAVKLNGELIAVAGGGGGGGGYTGSPWGDMSLWKVLEWIAAAGGYAPSRDRDGTFDYRPGGEGGTKLLVENYEPKPGIGSSKGAAGKNGVNDSSFSQFHKSPSGGSSASTSSGGGGGGGGGGGWPASGKGGSSGKKYMHFSSGGGGGAGMSWIKDGYQRVPASYPDDVHVYQGPLADQGTAKIFLNMRTTTKLTAPAQVLAGEPFVIRGFSSENRTPTVPLDGSANLYLGATTTSRIDYTTTDGNFAFTVPGKSAGTYTFSTEFYPRNAQSHFQETETRSQASVVVEVVDPPTPEPKPDNWETDTRLEVEEQSIAFNGGTTAIGYVTVDPRVNLAGRMITFEADGADLASTALAQVSPGEFRASIRLSGVNLRVGANSVVARFDGHLADPAILGSVSEAHTVTVRQTATTTEITSGPDTVGAYQTSLVTAQVASVRAGITGEAALVADGQILRKMALSSDGSVTFPGVVFPVGTQEYRVEFLGDAGGVFSPSQSTAWGLAVTDHATRTELTLPRAEVSAHDTVTITATVTNLDDRVLTDPRGTVEFLFDDEVVGSVPAGLDTDPERGDSEARYSLDVSEALLGEHRVTARFVPGPGFTASESDPQELRVLGIETRVVTDAAEVGGTPKKPATLGVTVESLENRPSARGVDAAGGAPVEGYVQAFVADEPVGDAGILEGGQARLTLSGMPVGQHQVEVRFTPEEHGFLKSSAAATAKITADPNTSGTGGGGGSSDVPSGSGDGSASPAGAGADGAGADGAGGDGTGTQGGQVDPLATTGAASPWALGAISLSLLLAALAVLRVRPRARA